MPGADSLAATWSHDSLTVRAVVSQHHEASVPPSVNGDSDRISLLGQHLALPRAILTLDRQDLVPLFQTWDPCVKSLFYHSACISGLLSVNWAYYGLFLCLAACFGACMVPSMLIGLNSPHLGPL